MKSMIVVALALVAVAAAVPVEVVPVQILRSIFDQKPNGEYNFEFESSDGNSRSETGELKTVVDEDNKPQQVVVVRGYYAYINNEGGAEKVDYTADESGYHAEGPSVPKAERR